MKTLKYLFLICLIFYPVFSQGVSYNEEFLVNTYTENNQGNPNAAGLANGTFVVCWESYGQDGSCSGIYGQLFNASGERIGQEFQVNTYTYHNQKKPSVAGLTDGRFIVCWESDGQDGDDFGIFAQLFNASGEKIGPEFQVNTFTDLRQSLPDVTGLADGKFVVCWQSDITPGSYDPIIYAQLFNTSAERIGQEFQVTADTIGYQLSPSLTGLANGTFVLVCWERWDMSDHDGDIYGQLLSSSGSWIGQEFQVNTYTKAYNYFPSVAGLADSKFVVCWGIDYYHGIYGQLFTASGEKIGQEFQVNTYTYHNQKKPSVAGLTDGRFIVCWESDGQDGSEEGIYAKYYLDDPIIHELTSFELIEPLNDIILDVINPIFSWNRASSVHINFFWELVYNLYIDTSDSFTNPMIIEAIQDTIYKIDPLLAGRTYYWKVLAKNIAGDSLWSSNTNGFFVTYDAKPSAMEESEITQPHQFALEQNYPNPFNPTTTIPIILSNKSKVTISVYNTLGQKVATIVHGQSYPAGRHEFIFDGSHLASGVYIINAQIISEGKKSYHFNKKMLLLR
jgi:hypothetical protein